MSIYLVRHGEAAARWHESDNPGLSERGKAQAAEAARLLARRVDPDIRLYSSPMQRARETAEPLATALGAEVTIVAPFTEIPTPVAQADRQAWLTEIARQTWAEQVAMVRDWRGSLLARLRRIEEPAVVFTHFMVINVIVGALQSDDRVVCCLPDTASVTVLQGYGEALQVAELGRQLRTHVN